MKRVIALLLLGGALAVAGCGSSSSSTSSSTAAATTAAPAAASAVQSGLVQVKYHKIAISPANITVKVGSTIKWTNDDGAVQHNVTSLSGASFHSPDFAGGGTFEYKVTKPGVIKYQCTIHPASMNGTITVVN